ncbi:hypothetical protein KUTeg_017872 [Tegillarca granosa]|uniref:Uncharacterized protein n=1 Tax=Tegillarca granosa TaxID=220873 RepID=A0ABQ9EHR6_TEGGR|nr:hypothetical protein KUTeg_017872 [Tegillarca granosa]
MTEQLYRQMSKRPVRPPPPVPKPGNVKVVKALYNYDAQQVSVNGLDKAGSTPLHWAAHGGHIDCLEALLEKNCEVNVQNKLGDTPLHSAAWRGHADVVKILLDKGAVPSIRNNEKRMPLDLAKDNQCPQEQVLHKIMETKKTQTNSYLFLFVYCFFLYINRFVI